MREPGSPVGPAGGPRVACRPGAQVCLPCRGRGRRSPQSVMGESRAGVHRKYPSPQTAPKRNRCSGLEVLFSLRCGVDKWARGVCVCVCGGGCERGVRKRGPDSLLGGGAGGRGSGGRSITWVLETPFGDEADFPPLRSGLRGVGREGDTGLCDMAPVEGVQRGPGSREQRRPPHSACVALEWGRGPR